MPHGSQAYDEIVSRTWSIQGTTLLQCPASVVCTSEIQVRLFVARVPYRIRWPNRRTRRFLVSRRIASYTADSPTALVTEPTGEAVVEIHIALTYFLLNDPIEAQHWLTNEAYAKATATARELAEHTGNTRVIKGKGFVQAATAYMTLGASAAYLAAKKVKRTYEKKHAEEGLRAVLPLVACIASTYAALGGDSTKLPALQLREIKKNSYELVEATS
jgi:hypothetical protein